MSESVPNATPVSLISARRVYWSSGFLFALLMLMILSGLASITLLYDDVSSTENLQGVEGAVLDIVRTLRPGIRLLHEYGGYLAMFLSGWLAVELVRFAQGRRKAGSKKARKDGLMVMVLGVPAAVALIVCLVFLVGTGIEARRFMGQDTGGSAVVGLQFKKLELTAQAQESKVVEAHTGLLTYLLAGAVVLLVLAVQKTRNIAQAED